MPLVDGDILAGHTILNLIGSGGMGEVYLAIHPRLPRRVALKVLPPDTASDAEFRDRFAREADLAADLYHPHIVGVNDRGEDSGRLWISMDYVEGTDGAHLMHDKYPTGMPVSEVIPIVEAVARALDYAHQHGLLHRDVKPSNILLTNADAHGERRILLGDFGIARELADVSGLTATNVTVGTVLYAAPEQLMGSDIDGRADQYALAATAFHLLTGTPLYANTNPVAVISQHLNLAPPSLSDRRADLAVWDAVFAKALAKDPEHRYPHCRDFASALVATGDSEPPGDITQTANPVSATAEEFKAANVSASDAETSASTRRRRNMAVLVSVVALALCGMAFGAWKFLPNAQNAANKSPAPPAAVLNGVYRIDYNMALLTVMGSPLPPPADQPQTEVSWRAFRSSCAGQRCTANSVALDSNDHQKVDPAGPTSEWAWKGNHWESSKKMREKATTTTTCEGSADQPGGADTRLSINTLEPQHPVAGASPATLQAHQTKTVVSNECSNIGAVYQVPGIATRVADLPPTITIPQPEPTATVPGTSPDSIAGPTLNGIYRVTIDFSRGTVNGTLAPSGGLIVETWAFHSECTHGGCVATGTLVDNDNYADPRMGSTVARFTENRWQMARTLDRLRCAQVNARAGSDNDVTFGVFTRDLQPQPDGSFTGTYTNRYDDNACGLSDHTSITPCSAIQVSPTIPNSVVLADPALFVS